MTVGAKIQKYRKALGLSQEELGEKLFVSRQTISLWEKDQTVPTIDNLIRLRDIFSVSVDEILGLACNENIYKDEPSEAYRFVYTEKELNELHRLQRRIVYKKPILFSLICVFLIVFLSGSSAPDMMVGFAFGMFFVGAVSYFKAIHTYNKVWRSSVNRICDSTYEYQLFENYMGVYIYRNNEIIRESKCCYSDIEQIQQCGSWLLFQFGGQSFIVRKNYLKENSAFYSYMYQNPAKTIDNPVPDKWKIASVVLFAVSLLSILGALVLVNTVSAANGLFVENMWLFFLMTPIPVASTAFGFVLKARGYKYKKNVVVGIIMTLFLCIYGSFTFML